MLPEYDFTGGVRGQHYQAYRRGHNVTIHQTDEPMLIVGWALPTDKNTREVQDVSNENSLSPLPIFKSDPPSLSLHLLNNPHRLHADGADSIKFWATSVKYFARCIVATLPLYHNSEISGKMA